MFAPLFTNIAQHLQTAKKQYLQSFLLIITILLRDFPYLCAHVYLLQRDIRIYSIFYTFISPKPPYTYTLLEYKRAHFPISRMKPAFGGPSCPSPFGTCHNNPAHPQDNSCPRMCHIDKSTKATRPYPFALPINRTNHHPVCLINHLVIQGIQIDACGLF